MTDCKPLGLFAKHIPLSSQMITGKLRYVRNLRGNRHVRRRMSAFLFLFVAPVLFGLVLGIELENGHALFLQLEDFSSIVDLRTFAAESGLLPASSRPTLEDLRDWEANLDRRFSRHGLAMRMYMERSRILSGGSAGSGHTLMVNAFCGAKSTLASASSASFPQAAGAPDNAE